MGSVQDLLETERTSRARELQDLKKILSRQINDSHSAEKAAREVQFEELLQGVAASKIEVNQRFNQTDAMHAGLRSSYEKLANAHAVLSSAHNGLATSHSQSCESQKGELNSIIESERNARTLGFSAMADAHAAELAKIRNIVQVLEASVNEDRARTMNEHTDIRSCTDNKHNELKQTIEERLATLEKKFVAVEPQWSADFNMLREQINSALATMQTKITKEQNSLKQFVDATQNQICTTTQAAVAGNAKIIREESAQRCESTKELQDKIKDILQAMATLSNLKVEITGEYKLFVGEFQKSLEQRYLNPSKQLDDIMEMVKLENEKSMQDMQARIEEVRSSLISERSLHLKWMGEERDARLRQASDLRTEFVKIITKEREDRVIDASV